MEPAIDTAKREAIIFDYVKAYNACNIDKMIENMDRSVTFENISNGQTNMIISGLDDFRKQAEKAATIFSTRLQTVRSIKHDGDFSEVEIEYNGTLATDVPNGLKKGERLALKANQFSNSATARSSG